LYSALRENTANALNDTQCHSNRCVFTCLRPLHILALLLLCLLLTSL